MQDIRKQFPILQETVWGHPLVYLDNAATTHKPQSVIDAVVNYYLKYNSNVHRGIHFLSQQATDMVENARMKIANFIHAKSTNEIIFTKGTTDSLNLIAQSFCRKYLKEGDEILLTEMEHHSNIVPWFIIAEQLHLKVRFLPITISGELDFNSLENFITVKTKVISMTWVSNTLGTVNDISKIIEIAHSKGIKVIIDAAQAVQHFPVDVQKLDIDFLVASGHKMYAPTGIGFLYGKEELLKELDPYQGGGSMIKTVTKDGFTPQDLPFRFEAGTPHMEGMIGMGAAIDFLESIGMENIERHESEIIQYTKECIHSLQGIKIIGENNHQSGALSLVFENCHSSDVGEIIDKRGIAARVGQHCCQPIMDYFQISGTLRISFALYTDKNDIDRAVDAIEKAVKLLS